MKPYLVLGGLTVLWLVWFSKALDRMHTRGEPEKPNVTFTLGEPESPDASAWHILWMSRVPHSTTYYGDSGH